MGERAISARSPDPKLVTLVEQKTATLTDPAAWASITVLGTGCGVPAKGIIAFRDAVWALRKVAKTERRLARLAARQKKLAERRARRAEKDKLEAIHALCVGSEIVAGAEPDAQSSRPED